ncbi:MAG: DUF58 domain-containing protein [Lachnospiraceae bacterium]|nr:DUF58 domain-containing protein [Lachnospiraceae bacterium]
MKKERIVFFIILGLLLVAFLLTGQGWVAIVLSVMLFYLLLAILLFLLTGRKLTVSMSCEEEVQKKQEAEIKVQLQNLSVIPVTRCDLVLQMQNQLNGESSQEVIRGGVLPKRRRTFQLAALDNHCGIVKSCIVSARIGDPLGLFSRKLIIESAGCECLVMPHLYHTGIRMEEMEHYDMESFRYADAKVGTDSSETVSIREYTEGDSVRAIHWKLSAKTGDIMIKEYGYPVDSKTVLIADKRKKADLQSVDDIDRLTEFSLSTSLTLTEQEANHVLGWYDANASEFICRSIQTADDLYEAIPDFLRAPFVEKGADPALRFLESGAEKGISGFLYITQNPNVEDAGMEHLKETGYVTILTPEEEQPNMD